MDFMVSEVEKDVLVTDALQDETYPGLKVYEMTKAQSDAVKEAVNVQAETHHPRHLSPIISDAASETEDDDDQLQTPTDPAHNEYTESTQFQPTGANLDLKGCIARTASSKSIFDKSIFDKSIFDKSSRSLGATSDHDGTHSAFTQPNTSASSIGRSVTEGRSVTHGALDHISSGASRTIEASSLNRKQEAYGNDSRSVGELKDIEGQSEGLLSAAVSTAISATAGPQRMYDHGASSIPTIPTPNIFSKLSEDRFVEELREEVSQLRRRVAVSAKMKTLMSKLNGQEDLAAQIEVIKSYSKRKFALALTDDDFEALSTEQVQGIYKKTRESEKSDRFELIYKTVFDFGVTALEQMLNKYVFQINDLREYLLYDDISAELGDFKHAMERTVIGRYVDHTSPVTRVLSYIAIQITRAKLKM